MARSGVTSQAQPVPTFAESVGETFSSNAGADQTVQEVSVTKILDWDSLILPEPG